ncbi:MAG TPA: hypothetical protein VGN70_04970, partial [Gammaproteobacteria bacterium]
MDTGRIHIASLIVGIVAVLISISVLAAVPGKDHDNNMFGGAVDQGSASLDLTAALVQAGGGPERFSMKTALISMLGQEGADQEIGKLQRQYGSGEVQHWLQGSDWLVLDGLNQLRNTGTDLPPPDSDLTGAKLASALVDAGVAPGDTAFWTGYYYDHLFSHAVNKVLETDMNRKFSERYAKDVYAVNNQVMYDLSQS